MADPYDRLENQRIEIERLRTWLQTIVDCWDARSELYTSDAEMAANFADRARAALEGRMICAIDLP